MSDPIKRRSVAVAFAVAALLLASFAAAPQAGASTISVCVKKSSGAIRLITGKAKCKKGESKVSWNSRGPAGANGANGANGASGANGVNGTNGANGAVGGFSVAQQQGAFQELPLSENPEFPEEVEVLEKILPAGHYVITAKAELLGVGKSVGLAAAYCEIYDANSKEEVDLSEWGGYLSFLTGSEYFATSTVPMVAAVSASTPLKIEIWCASTANSATSGKVREQRAAIVAVQTSSNS